MITVACKKIYSCLAEKRQKRTFSAEKIRILRNLWLNVRQKALIISVGGKQWKMQFTTTVN